MSNSKVKKIFVLSFIFLFGQKAWPYELPSSVSSIRVNSNDTVMTLSDGGTRVVTKSTRFLGRVLSYLSGVLNIIVGSPAGMSNVGEGLCYEHYSYEADRGESTTRLSPDGPSYAAAAVLIMSNPELLVVPLSACVATISFILFAKNAQTADRICLQPDKSLEFGHFASNHIWARAKLSEGTYITPDGIAIRGKFKNGEIARDSEPEIILLNGDGYSIRFNHTETSGFDGAIFDDALFRSNVKYNFGDRSITFPNGDIFRGNWNGSPVGIYTFRNGTAVSGFLGEILEENVAEKNREKIKSPEMGENTESREKGGRAMLYKSLERESPLSISSISVNSNGTAVALSNGYIHIVTRDQMFPRLAFSFIGAFLIRTINVIAGHPARIDSLERKGDFYYEYPPYDIGYRMFAATSLMNICSMVLISSISEWPTLLSMDARVISLSVFMDDTRVASRVYFRSDGSLEFGYFASDFFWDEARLSEGTHITPDGIAIRGKFKNGEIARDSEPEIILLNGDGYSIRFNHTETSGFDGAIFDDALFRSNVKYNFGDRSITFPNGDIFRGNWNGSPVGIYTFRNGTAVSGFLGKILEENVVEKNREKIKSPEMGENTESREKSGRAMFYKSLERGFPSSISSISVNSNGTAVVLSNGDIQIINAEVFENQTILKNFLGYVSRAFNIARGYPVVWARDPIKGKVLYEQPPYGTMERVSATAVYSCVTTSLINSALSLIIPSDDQLPATVLTMLTVSVDIIFEILSAWDQDFSHKLYLEPDGPTLEFGLFVSDPFWAKKRLSKGTHITPDRIAIRGRFENGEMVEYNDPEIILLNRDGYSIKFSYAETNGFDGATFDNILFRSSVIYNSKDRSVTFPNGDIFRGDWNGSPMGTYTFRNGTEVSGFLREILEENMAEENRKKAESGVERGMFPEKLWDTGKDVPGIDGNGGESSKVGGKESCAAGSKMVMAADVSKNSPVETHNLLQSPLDPDLSQFFGTKNQFYSGQSMEDEEEELLHETRESIRTNFFQVPEGDDPADDAI